MATRSLGSLVIDFLARTGGFEQGMTRSERVFKDSTDKMKRQGKSASDEISKVFTGLAGKITAALGAITAGVSIGKTINVITGFQDAMLKLQATSQSTAESMRQLESQARSLGATTRFSAQQAADAQNFLAMAGFSTAEILQSTGTVLQFASAASLDLARAADIASNVIGQMRMPVSEMGRAMDVMVVTTQSANTNIEQLADAFSYVGPVAAAAGLSVEEVAAAIGVLGDAGIQSSRAGTGLQGVLQHLLNITPAASEALARYGITAQDVDITVHGLEAVLRRLGEANISAADSMTIFGAVSAASALNLTASADSVGRLIEKNKEAAGSVQEVATLLDSGLSAAFASVVSGIEEMMLQIGEGGLGSALQVLAVTTAGVISAFNGLLPEFVESSGISTQFASNIEMLTGAIKTLGTVAIAVIGGRIVGALYTSTVAFSAATIEAVKYQAALARMAGVSATAAAGITALSTAARVATGVMAVLGGPAGLIATVALAGAAFLTMGKNAKEAAPDLSALQGTVEEVTENFSKMERSAQGALMAGLALKIRDTEKELRSLASTTVQMTQFTRDLGDMSDTLYNSFTQAAKGMQVDWNDLSKAVLENGTITEEAREYFLKIIGETAKLSGEIYQLEGQYYTLTDAVETSSAALSQSGVEQSKAEIAKRLAAAATSDYIAELEKEIKKMEDSIKTTRQLAMEYITLHGLQGGDAEAILAVVERYEKASAAQERHRESLKKTGASVKKNSDELQRLVDNLLPGEKASNELAKSTKILDSGLKAGKISAGTYSQAIAQLAENYEKSVLATNKNIDAIKSEQSTVLSNIESMREKIRNYGLSEQAINSLAQSETAARIAMLESVKATETANGASKERIMTLNGEIEALKALQGLLQTEGLLIDQSVALDKYDDIKAQILDMNQEIGDTLTDALMRGFESGVGFFENMKNAIMNIAKTWVIKPLVEPIANSISGSLFGALGGSGGGVANNSLGIASLVSKLSGGITQGVAGSIGKIGSALGSSTLQAFASGMSGSAVSGALAAAGQAGAMATVKGVAGLTGLKIGSGAAASLGTTVGTGSLAGGVGAVGSGGAMGAGAMAGAALPWVAGGLAAYSLISSLTNKGETRYGGGFVYDPATQSTRYAGGPSGGYDASLMSNINTVFKGAADTLNDVFKGVGADVTTSFFHGAFESSGKGRGGVFSGGALNIGGVEVAFGGSKKGDGYGGTSGSTEEMFANLQTDISYSVLEGLKAASEQLPSVIADVLNSVDIRSIGAEYAQEMAAGIMQTVKEVNALQDAFNKLPFANLKGLTFDVANAVKELSGGLENVLSNLGGYYQYFVPEAERMGLAVKALSSDLKDAGVYLPRTREEFRSLTDALDLTTQSGQAAWVALLNASDAANDYYSTLEAVTNSISGTIGSLYERITLDIMKDDEQRYNYYKNQFDSLAQQLDFAEDAQHINEIVQKMTEAASSAYGLLDEEARKGGVGQEYLDRMDQLQEVANQRLEQSYKNATDNQEETLNRITDSLVGSLDASGANMAQSAAQIGAWASGVSSSLNSVASALSRAGTGQEVNY